MRRNYVDMAMDVLEAIYEGEGKPTRLMYRANLSWGALDKILKDLVFKRMVWIKETGKRKRYRISERGISTLKHYLFVQGRFK